MANWNPLTNAVGGNGATSHNTYYNTNPTNFGEYGYIYLTEIVDNFVATYTGTGKILANVQRSDINFHAHRALQELSYDTLRSIKSQEIEVCPSLKMPLPHDYVNHVKLTSVDSNGIEHILYPARHTSNPFSINQEDGCTYDMEDGVIKHQADCEADIEKDCDADEMQAWIDEFFGQNAVTLGEDIQSGLVSFPYSVTVGSYDEKTFDTFESIYLYISTLIDSYCECVNSVQGATYSCGQPVGWVVSTQYWLGIDKWWDSGSPLGGGWDGAPWAFPNALSGQTFAPSLTGDGIGPILFSNIPDFNSTTAGVKWIDLNLPSFVSIQGTASGECTLFSNTWDSYSSGGGTTIGTVDGLNPSVDNSNYFTNTGERYGLNPEHAQVNGSYFMDYLRGNIHFSSALSGETIILKYISDGHGAAEEQIIPKLAEEAMYKWIAYGCAQARSDVDGGTIARFKKEKFAETRKAKIRLSNIKIEEISQVFRGKSKWIKH